MAIPNVGERVGAILGAENQMVTFFGYGVYQGEKVPDVPEDSRGLAPEMAKAGHPSHCIELDNGEIVYGCECWWGPERMIKRRIETLESKGFEVVEVLPSVMRRPVEVV